jgi:monothiol glutaredoxin
MTTEPAVFEDIRKIIADNEVVLFMKGTKYVPQCGFSATVARILEITGVEYQDVNVLVDPDIREGIKAFSDWPTIPQLYVKGEFLGGCDIVREMYETGELRDALANAGVATAA